MATTDRGTADSGGGGASAGSGQGVEHEEHREPVIVATFPTRGEAEVADAKLRAYGIESSIDDLIEGGAIPVEGEPGVNIVVHPEDAVNASRVLEEVDATVAEPAID